MKISEPFVKYLGYKTNYTVDVKRQYEVLDARPQMSIVHQNPYGKRPNRTYENLDEYPELKHFLENFEPNRQSLEVYGTPGSRYTVEVWNSCAYVISEDDRITAYHINDKYELQSGDSKTYVYNLNDSFAVYNDGDVYSVVLIQKN